MEKNSSLSIAKLMLPKMPMIGKTLVSHTLGISPHSTHWDLKTELTVNILRSFLCGTPFPISKTQAATLHDSGIKGRIWISKVTLAIPSEDDIRQKLFKVIEEMKVPLDPRQSLQEGGFQKPDLLPVEGEWTGHRAHAPKNAARLSISEAQQYIEMMKEVTSPVTILYMHGGAHWLLDPASYRGPCKKLAKLTGGRVLSLRYRLAPQNPFPAALLDCLVAYIHLLYPPENSFHTAVPAENIVLSGDSAGGNLSLSLLLLLLHLHKTSTPILWNGVSRHLPLPAGLALNSPWTDLLRSSPSMETNSKYDYIPPPSLFSPSHSIPYPRCKLWPTASPRSNVYCEDALLMHPLVSPLAADASAWEGSPPILFMVGTELLSDENKILACRLARRGVRVRWEEYEWMPHCFALALPHLKGTRKCFEGWAGFCREVVERMKVDGEGGKEMANGRVETRGVMISANAKGIKETRIDVERLWDESDEIVIERMKEQARILEEEGKMKEQNGSVNGGGTNRARL
ncbi:hypothetical protein BCIN_11g00340 [Botrytis cinerea B05.10]|uniref:Alpha/beta hydrolase fold-3 domain-containing protein n=3 Tax=Botryotinia fuckeliana TaxID=40559 RepID=A0A384JVT4_BOTFB|nr:hypothetical protein BCIN_11g00340 [Botrytis cinerea B05.10]ATZ54683.1 hypothetical protein BCIN_11g00340 [Botrytis cinerea B05.10]EMR87131.1 putative lipase esterase protein [Botrytis cinerea BcDW1]CCD34422.1 similar to lipase/esterase [Botrytis cinerea T4]